MASLHNAHTSRASPTASVNLLEKFDRNEHFISQPIQSEVAGMLIYWLNCIFSLFNQASFFFKYPNTTPFQCRFAEPDELNKFKQNLEDLKSLMQSEIKKTTKKRSEFEAQIKRSKENSKLKPNIQTEYDSLETYYKEISHTFDVGVCYETFYF